MPPEVRQQAPFHKHLEGHQAKERERGGGGGGWGENLEAAVASKGHLQQCDGQAAVADIMACRDAALPEQALGCLPSPLQRCCTHIWNLITHLQELFFIKKPASVTSTAFYGLVRDGMLVDQSNTDLRHMAGRACFFADEQICI